MRYKTKNVQFEAVQWTGDNVTVIEDFLGKSSVNYARNMLQVKVSDGRWLTAAPGWWVARMGHGTIVLYSDASFEDLFEEV